VVVASTLVGSLGSTVATAAPSYCSMPVTLMRESINSVKENGIKTVFFYNELLLKIKSTIHE
jgi:hypothetical protein